ncbi:unnamed protein product [Urochloa humidicola]
MPRQSPPLMQQQRQGLLGPRPATLKVSSTNNKIKEKRPVIIYVESPKVVHAHPSEFKSVVQRLTGAPPPPSAHLLLPPEPPLQFPFQLPSLVATMTSSCLPPPMAATSSLLPADAAAPSSLGFFINGDQMTSPAAFLYDHHHHHQRSALLAATPPPSLGACYRHGDLFVNLH